MSAAFYIYLPHLTNFLSFFRRPLKPGAQGTYLFRFSPGLEYWIFHFVKNENKKLQLSIDYALTFAYYICFV